MEIQRDAAVVHICMFIWLFFFNYFNAHLCAFHSYSKDTVLKYYFGET